jgi:hypothetical protein
MSARVAPEERRIPVRLPTFLVPRETTIHGRWELSRRSVRLRDVGEELVDRVIELRNHLPSDPLKIPPFLAESDSLRQEILQWLGRDRRDSRGYDRVTQLKVWPWSGLVKEIYREIGRKLVIERFHKCLSAWEEALRSEVWEELHAGRHPVHDKRNSTSNEHQERPLPAMGTEHATPAKRQRGRPPDKLREYRRSNIQRVAATGKRGADYCKALDDTSFTTPVAWQHNQGCPKSYMAAWNHPNLAERKKWRRRIDDERYNATARKIP